MFQQPQTVSPTYKTESPAYTPTSADGSVITAGLNGFRPNNAAASVSTSFKTLIGGAGGLGRLPQLAKRTLIGGS